MSSPRRWMRRAMLSALAGGGLTAAGLGGPVVGALPSADASAATGGGGPAEDTVTSSSASTPAPSAPEQGTTSETTTTTTATTTAPPSVSSTSSAAPPTPTPASAPAPAPAPVPAQAPSAPQAPSGASAPTVVVQRKQPVRPKRSGSKTGSEGVSAKGPGGAGSKGANSPALVPPGTPNNVAPAPQVVAAQAGTLASVLGQSAVSAQALEFYRVPLFLLPIYQAAGIQYGVPWQVLAAINEVETDYGTNVSVSSAGAVGWMQFMPETWLQYGVDALGAGYADPYNPVDAVFAAARYLHAAGASSNLHTAILAYNHSDAYVESVLLRAKLIASYPQSVIATLTGLTEGRLPVAGARIAADPSTSALALSPSSATAGAVPVEASASPVAPAPGAAPAPAPSTAAASAANAASAPAAKRGKAGEEPRFIDLLGTPAEAVTAAEDGRIVKLGRSHKLGNYLALRDIYGDVFTYAGLGSIAPRYHVLANPVDQRLRAHGGGNAEAGVGGGATAKAGAAAKGGANVKAGGNAKTGAGVGASPSAAVASAARAGAHDPKPTLPASAGSHPLTLHVKASKGHAAVEAEEQSLSGAGAVPAGMGRVRLYAHPGNPVARVAAARAAARSNGQSDGHGGRWLPLRLGSIVSQGTVLGHLKGAPGQGAVPSEGAVLGQGAVPSQESASGQGAASGQGSASGLGAASGQGSASGQGAAHLSVPLGSHALGTLGGASAARSVRLRFAIRPAGDTTTIDAGPILANWRQLDVALHPKGAKGGLDLLGATAAQVFLMSQSELERTVLSDPGIEIYACGRQDIASGAIDGRVLATLEFLSRSGLRPTVSALRCGHGEFTTSGNVSEHYFGDAVDISAINGIPIAGHQGAGSIADVTIRALLTLQGRFVPHQIISLMKYPEASNTLALPDHWNHIHVGFRPVGSAPTPAPGATDAAAHSAGKAGQPAPSPLAVTPELSAAQWDQLIARIATLQQPTVSAKPSSAAIRDPQAAPTNHDLGSRALPSTSSASEGSGVEE